MTHERLDTVQYVVYWPSHADGYDSEQVESDDPPPINSLWDVWFLHKNPDFERRGYINTSTISKIIIVRDQDRI